MNLASIEKLRLCPLKVWSLAVLLGLLCAPAWAINKCTGPDGKVAFQDAPCADGRGGRIDVRPASGYAQPVEQYAPSADGTAAPKPQRPMTETEKIEANVARSERERRITLLESRLIPDARANVRLNRQKCNLEIELLQARKGLASNNLAGATWEQSISTEMAALATRCDTQGRYITSTADDLQKELNDLKAMQRN